MREGDTGGPERDAGAGHRFGGVLNGGFFKTAGGIRFMEFNARFGDPEALNVLAVMETPLSAVLESVRDGSVSERSVSFAPRASVVKYVVAKEYPSESPAAAEFSVDLRAVSGFGVRAYLASCVRSGDSYRTLRRSRVAAFCAVADGIAEASETVNEAIDRHVSGSLEYRRDIGSATGLHMLDEAARRIGDFHGESTG